MSPSSRSVVVGTLAAIIAIVFAPACSSTVHGAGGSSGSAGGSSGSSGGNDPGAPPSSQPCTSRSDCSSSGHDPSCAAPSCDNGICAFVFSPKGTILPAQTPGDCRRQVCDGAGGVEDQPDPGDLPVQSAGDCKTAGCDASGNVMQTPDDDDLPAAKAECAPTTCKGGGAVMTPKAAGDACTEGGGRFCNGSGACRYCPTIDLTMCPDDGTGAPNNSTPDTAFQFPNQSNDDAARRTECGVLKPGDTAHWLTFVGSAPTFLGVDEFVTDPAVLLFAPVPVHTCIYIDATYGSEFSCPPGTTMDTAPAPLDKPGCCQDLTQTGFTVKSPDERQVWIRIELPSASTCVPYELTFHD
jgi:hypothetical protein